MIRQKIGMLLCARTFRSEDDIEFTLELIRNHALGCVQVPYAKPEIMARIKEVADYSILLITSDKVSAVLHFGNPAAMLEIDHVPRRMFGYLMPESQMRAIEVLAGKLPAKGKLPYALTFR